MADKLEQIVLNSLDAEDPNILRAACIMSGVLGLEQAERGLIKALGHKAWQIQAEAAKALGHLGLQGAVPYLRRILKASDADLRQVVLASAAGAAQQSGDEEDSHPELKKQAALAISRLQPKVAQDALMGALESGQGPLMGAALSGLGNLDVSDAIEAVVALADNPDVAVKKAAAACMGKLRATTGLRQLLALLQDADAGVRKEALIALNHIKEKQALGPMAACLEDPDADVRRVAAIALGNTRQRAEMIVQPLIKALGDHDSGVREAALKSLANVKAPEALEAVAALLADSHEEVKRQAGATVTVLAAAKERPDYPPLG